MQDVKGDRRSDNNIRKAELRREIKRKTLELRPSDIIESDKCIVDILLNLPELVSSKTVFCYVSIGAEVDTLRLITYLLDAGMRVAVPRRVRTGIMEARVIVGFGDLSAGKYGIMEPDIGCTRLTPDEINVAIVPCVTCDSHCNRLGHGGGYYDRFLTGRAYPAVALCREYLMSISVPVDPAIDQPVDIVVSETQVFRRNV